MDRRTIRVAVVALLCIVAIAAAAATLTSTQEYGAGTGSGPGTGPGSGGNQSFEGETGTPTADRPDKGEGEPTRVGVCLEILRTPEAILTALALAALVLGITVRQYDRFVALGLTLSLGPLLVALWRALANCGGLRFQVARNPGNVSNVSLGSEPSGTGGGGTVPSEPSVLVLAILGGLLLVALVVVVRSTDDETVDLAERTEPSPADDEEAAPEAIGRIAGETADRIDESGDLDNEVYRAWREMVAELDVDNPDATTPGEFADAAAGAGMARDDVRTLTDVFEAVRYGGADPTADRERRAVEALRRIEREYGGADR